MRINKYVATATGMSRRAADAAVEQGRVTINDRVASLGTTVAVGDKIILDGKVVIHSPEHTTIMLNKPAGYVCSRNGQGSKTIYDLLPSKYNSLKPVGRLDKNSSGLLLLTDDGDLAQTLTHPRHRKIKIYEVTLDKPLLPLHRQMMSDYGISLDDGRSQLGLERWQNGDDKQWIVTMHEGRNRQIRRTFAALGYNVRSLHRTQFGSYSLDELPPGEHRAL